MLAAGARNQGVVSDQVAFPRRRPARASLLIDGHKLKNHSVPATKLTAGAVQSLRGQRGPRGAQGIQGEQGEQGEQGAPGLSGYVSGTGGADATASVAAGAQGFAASWCPAGTQALGGGYFPLTAGTSALRTVSASFAINDVTGAPGFLVEMANDGSGAAESFRVRCAAPTFPE
jgi:hypothetical protein